MEFSMKGYCEGCSCEQYSKKDEYNVDVCTACEGDLVVGVHVEDEYDEELTTLQEDYLDFIED
jgi:hypothetical protein